MPKSYHEGVSVARKSQAEIDSEKKVTNPTKKYKPTIADAWFERRQRWPKTPERMKELGRILIEEANNEKGALFMMRIAQKLGISYQYLRELTQESPELKSDRDFAREILGTRQLEGAVRKQLDREVVIKYLRLHVPDLVKDIDTNEDARKIKLASQGVTEGQTKIVVVNENVTVKEDKPE